MLVWFNMGAVCKLIDAGFFVLHLLQREVPSKIQDTTLSSSTLTNSHNPGSQFGSTMPCMTHLLILSDCILVDSQSVPRQCFTDI